MKRSSAPSNFYHLPERLQKRITEGAFPRRTLVHVDLNESRQDLPGLLFVNKTFYLSEAKKYFTADRFTLNLTLDVDQDVTADLSAIDRWLRAASTFGMTPAGVSVMKGRSVRDIRLHFIVRGDTPCALEDLRINVEPLLRHIAYLGDCRNPGRLRVCVEFTRSNRNGDYEKVDKHSFPVLQLQAAELRSRQKAVRASNGARRWEGSGVIVDGNGMWAEEPLLFVGSA